MKYRKKSKTLPVKPKLSSSATWGLESEARFQEFMDHAIGKYADAYLKNLALTVVHLKAISEIAALRSDLLKEKAEIARQTELITESKFQIEQAWRKKNLEMGGSLRVEVPCCNRKRRSRK